MIKQNQSASTIDPALIEAYSETVFHVFVPKLDIRIDQLNPRLDSLLVKYGNTCWAFITPFNPYSRILDDNENLERMLQMLNDLKGFVYMHGEGRGSDPRWKPELSVLVLGISLSKAKTIGKQYGQNAIVTGRKGGEAKLVLLQ